MFFDQPDDSPAVHPVPETIRIVDDQEINRKLLEKVISERQPQAVRPQGFGYEFDCLLAADAVSGLV